MEEIINKIPKLWVNNYRFCIAYHDCYWQIGYVSTTDANCWLSHPMYQTKSGETLLEGLIKFRELVQVIELCQITDIVRTVGGGIEPGKPQDIV